MRPIKEFGSDMTELEKVLSSIEIHGMKVCVPTSQFPGATGPLLDFLEDVPLDLLFAVAAHRFEQKSWVFVPSINLGRT